MIPGGAGGTSLQRSETTNQTLSTAQDTAQKSSGNWALIQQNFASGSARVAQAQSASDGSTNVYWILAGFVGVIVLWWIANRRR